MKNIINPRLKVAVRYDANDLIFSSLENAIKTLLELKTRLDSEGVENANLEIEINEGYGGPSTNIYVSGYRPENEKEREEREQLESSKKDTQKERDLAKLKRLTELLMERGNPCLCILLS